MATELMKQVLKQHSHHRLVLDDQDAASLQSDMMRAYDQGSLIA
jgi:hypothetical protein